MWIARNDFVIVSDIFNDYVFSATISEEAIRKRLEAYHLGLLKTSMLTGKIKEFVVTTYEKYRAEGE